MLRREACHKDKLVGEKVREIRNGSPGTGEVSSADIYRMYTLVMESGKIFVVCATALGECCFYELK